MVFLVIIYCIFVFCSSLCSELNPGYPAFIINAIERKLRKHEFSSDLHNLCTKSLEETHFDGTIESDI